MQSLPLLGKTTHKSVLLAMQVAPYSIGGEVWIEQITIYRLIPTHFSQFLIFIGRIAPQRACAIIREDIDFQSLATLAARNSDIGRAEVFRKAKLQKASTK